MKTLQRSHPFPDDLAYDGAVPEPIEHDQDATRASGLTLPELMRAELLAAAIRRAIAEHAGTPTKREAVRALLRSAADV